MKRNNNSKWALRPTLLALLSILLLPVAAAALEGQTAPDAPVIVEDAPVDDLPPLPDCDLDHPCGDPGVEPGDPQDPTTPIAPGEPQYPDLGPPPCGNTGEPCTGDDLPPLPDCPEDHLCGDPSIEPGDPQDPDLGLPPCGNTGLPCGDPNIPPCPQGDEACVPGIMPPNCPDGFDCSVPPMGNQPSCPPEATMDTNGLTCSWSDPGGNFFTIDHQTGQGTALRPNGATDAFNVHRGLSPFPANHQAPQIPPIAK